MLLGGGDNGGEGDLSEHEGDIVHSFVLEYKAGSIAFPIYTVKKYCAKCNEKELFCKNK